MYVLLVPERISVIRPDIQTQIMQLLRDIQALLVEVRTKLAKTGTVYKEEYEEELKEIEAYLKDLINSDSVVIHPEFIIEELDTVRQELEMLLDTLKLQEDEEEQ